MIRKPSKNKINAVIVHFDSDGELMFYAAGNVRLFIVDERAPNDRVFEWTDRVLPSQIASIIGDSPIGSPDDERHAAIEHKVVALVEGRPRLEVVPSPEEAPR